jgi:EAL domain-containing protein (putative c-di-GMP-specific phosphodiesterase class I)
LLVPPGREVIEPACIDLARRRTRALPIRRIAINLSACQLTADTGLPGFIDGIMARHGLRHSDLEFEHAERHGLQPNREGYAVPDALAQRAARIVIAIPGLAAPSRSARPGCL